MQTDHQVDQATSLHTWEATGTDGFQNKANTLKLLGYFDQDIKHADCCGAQLHPVFCAQSAILYLYKH